MASSSEISDDAVNDDGAISVVLLRNKKTKNILYMEASKDFVDLLLSFLTLPAGTIFRLLEEGFNKKIGALGNVFESVKKLENRSFYVDKDLLLKQSPNWSAVPNVQNRLLKVEAPAGPPAIPRAYYRCNCYGVFFSSQQGGSVCNLCRSYITTATTIYHDGPVAKDTTATAQPAVKAGKSGFVKKSLMFIVTDDLEVKLVSTISSIVLLNELKVESMADLESFPVQVGRTETLELLQASISSRSVLNNVFGPTTRFGEM